MLHAFLDILQKQEVQSISEIARRLGISPVMALQMAHELTQRGYLQEIGADCSDPQKPCPDCPAHNHCQAAVKHWYLTEKGKAAAAGR